MKRIRVGEEFEEKYGIFLGEFFGRKLLIEKYSKDLDNGWNQVLSLECVFMLQGAEQFFERVTGEDIPDEDKLVKLVLIKELAIDVSSLRTKAEALEVERMRGGATLN